jgi:hypothetical protein
LTPFYAVFQFQNAPRRRDLEIIVTGRNERVMRAASERCSCWDDDVNVAHAASGSQVRVACALEMCGARDERKLLFFAFLETQLRCPCFAPKSLPENPPVSATPSFQKWLPNPRHTSLRQRKLLQRYRCASPTLSLPSASCMTRSLQLRLGPFLPGPRANMYHLKLNPKPISNTHLLACPSRDSAAAAAHKTVFPPNL